MLDSLPGSYLFGAPRCDVLVPYIYHIPSNDYFEYSVGDLAAMPCIHTPLKTTE